MMAKPVPFSTQLPWLLVMTMGLSVVACRDQSRSLPSGEAPDQDGPFRTLELDAAYPEPFSYLSGVRELPDGRLLAADPLSQVLLRLDLEAGTADTLGSQGSGPEEYQGPDHVLPLPGDSSLLVDLGNARLTVLDSEGAFVDAIPMFRAREDGTARTIHPRFSDSAGVLYLPAAYNMEGAPPDSSGISRFHREENTETVVAWAWRPEPQPFDPSAKRPMLRPMDDWAVGPDGRVAVVRANGYSVDWYLPDGRILRGPTNTVETYPVSQAEKEAEMDNLASAALFTSVVVGEGGTESRRQMARGLPPGAEPGMDDFAWPERLPAFRPMGTLISPRGEAWVQRIMPQTMAPRYDVFDREGLRLGSVDLPPGSKVIGFGARPATQDRLYLTRTDEVGLVWLESYRLRLEVR